MPYTTILAGTWATASWANSNVRDQVVTPFTTSAARDAAITSPVEGMLAYLTAPSTGEYTSTGQNTFAPTGVLTVYNGARWVALTPISAYTATGGTLTSTSFTTTLSGSPGTNPSITIVTGTAALVTISAEMYVSGGAGNIWTSIDVSGASTIAAINQYGVTASFGAAASTYSTYSRTFLMTGLTAGANTFTLSYKVSASTGNVANRGLTVQGVI